MNFRTQFFKENLLPLVFNIYIIIIQNNNHDENKFNIFDVCEIEMYRFRDNFWFQKMAIRREREGILTKAILILGMRIFVNIQGAPTYSQKPWTESNLSPLISPPCPRNERCWNWLPVIESPDSYVLHEDPEKQALK